MKKKTPERNTVATGTKDGEQHHAGGGRYEFSKIRRPINRVGADGNPERVDQTYLVKKWVFPVRRQVMDRKKLPKFGDVKSMSQRENTSHG